MYLFGLLWIVISIFIGIFINIVTHYKKQNDKQLHIKDFVITILTIYLIFIIINNFLFIFEKMGIDVKQSYSTLIISSIIIMALNNRLFEQNLIKISDYILNTLLPISHDILRYIFLAIIVLFNILYIFYFKK